LEEKRNLTFGGGELPDVFYAASIPNSDLLKYGEQGVLQPLNDLIEDYAPNFKQIMEESPEVENAITFPDGNIYALPNIYDPTFTSLIMNATPWINQSFLDALDMDMPETTDEFYEYLKAVKNDDPNGNGEADEVPFGGYSIDYLTRWLRGSFGIANNGVNYIDLDEDTQEVRFYPISDGYKEMLEYVHKLYSEELIQQNIYNIEFNEYLSYANEGIYGSTYWYSPEEEFGDVGDDYVSGLPLKGPHGDQKYVDIGHPAFAMGRFAITEVNENPEATMRWVDYFYGDEGSKFFYMGIEGETYEETEDGEYKYVDRITNSPDGLTMNEELVKDLAWVGSSSPSIIKQEYFQGTENSPQALEAGEILEPYFIEDSWPPEFTYTNEENKKLTGLATDIEKYVDEEKDKFITGQISFDEWDQYVERLEKMGLEEYLSIKQAAYDRYKDE